MDDDDYLPLLRELQDLLIANELPELANVSKYSFRDRDGYALPSFQDLAAKMLMAFNRHLAIIDASTYQDSIDTLREYSKDFPEGAEAHVLLSEEEVRLYGLDYVSLANREDLSTLRQQVSDLTVAIGNGLDDAPEPPLGSTPS